MPDDAPKGMKSAYEAALEKLESQGIARPESGHLTDEQRHRIEEARRRSVAKLAEIEILHRNRLAGLRDPVAQHEERDDYARDRRRIEDECEREIGRIKAG